MSVKVICPMCSKYAEGIHDGVFLTTKCDDCGDITSRLEVDQRFIDKFGFNRTHDVFKSIIVNITDECNTSCNLCYYPCEKGKHKSMEWVKETCAKYPEYAIYFSGGEPTCHPYFFELAKIPNLMSVLTNGIKFADLSYCKEYIDKVGYDKKGFLKVTFSVHTGISEKKRKALENLRLLRQATNIGMFSIMSLEEIPEIIEIWKEFQDVIYHARIRTPFNTWMQRDIKTLWMSEVYEKVRELLPHFEVTEELGGNSIFNVNLEYQGRYLSLCSAPCRTAFPVDYLQYAPKMLALDGNIYPTPVTLRLNEVFHG